MVPCHQCQNLLGSIVEIEVIPRLKLCCYKNPVNHPLGKAHQMVNQWVILVTVVVGRATS